MSLNEMNDKLSELYTTAYKFTSIRNPYDLMISAFHQKVIDIEDAANISRSNNDELKAMFLSYVEKAQNQKGHFFLDDEFDIDYTIRYENLKGDIKELCHILNIAFSEEDYASQFPHLRNRNRSQYNLKFESYFTNEAVKCTSEKFKYWFDLGNYTVIDSVDDFANYSPAGGER